MLVTKTIVFLGSSVTDGDNGYSMCEYIAEKNGYNVIKYAVRGTTLADVSEQSYVRRLRAIIDETATIDCFVCQLSTNDASQALPLGTISDSLTTTDFDVSTIIGAIEYIVSSVKNTKNCPVLFYTGTFMESDKYAQMVEALTILSRKWGFSVIDLWNSDKMRNVSEKEYNVYMKDSVHPSKTGYCEWWGPEFIKAIKEVFDD